MALQGFLTSTGYANIADIHYMRHHRTLLFDVFVYTDATKSTLINSFPMEIRAWGDVLVCSDYTNKAPEPGDHPEGTVLLYKDETAPLEKAKNRVISFGEVYGEGDQHLDNIPPEHNSLLDVTSDGKKYRWDEFNQKWVERDVYLTLSNMDWDMYFGIEAMDVAGKNLVRLIYEYLKLRPDFSGCVDV